MQETVNAFSDEAYTWTLRPDLGQMVVVGPRVRIGMEPQDARRFLLNHEVRYFSHAEGLVAGWYSAIEAGSDPNPFGKMVGYVVVAPCSPPDGAVTPEELRCSNCGQFLNDVAHMFDEDLSEREWKAFFVDEYGYMCPRCWKAFKRGRDAENYNLNVLENDD